jgi:hypothetical protein
MIRTYLVLLAGLLSLVAACDDIFEDDITEEQVQLLTPGDSLTISGEVSFNWEPLNGARSYHLQVVEGAFDSAVGMKEDTLLTKNQFNLTLPQGKYAWRVRAENSGYSSSYSYRSFDIGI